MENRELTGGLQKIVSSLPVDHSGTTVYLKGWRLEASERPPVIVVHDLGEHAELYRHTAERFAHAGYTTYVFDLRGHGRSGRRLGHAPSFSVLVKDLLQVAAWVRHKENGKAPVILGHGIGALIAIEFTQHHGAFCRAAILSAPCLEPHAETSLVTRWAVKMLAELHPVYRLPPALFPRFARGLIARAKQAAAVDAEDEPAPTPKLSAALAHELLQAIERVEARFIEYHGSVLILCPARDEISGFAKVRKAAALHDEHNLRLEELVDTGHDVFTDGAACERAFGVILPWLDAVTAAKPADEAQTPLVPPAPRAAREPALKPGASKE